MLWQNTFRNRLLLSASRRPLGKLTECQWLSSLVIARAAECPPPQFRSAGRRRRSHDPRPMMVAGLPFRTRGKSGNAEEQQEQQLENGFAADAIIDSGDIAEIKVVSPKKGSRRNPIVETFFDDDRDGNAASSSSLELLEDISIRSQELSQFLVTTRRALHRRPELMYQEKETSAYVQQVLRELDISFTTGWAVNTKEDRIPGPGGYGIVADIGTGGPPCVLLRADMDALPIVERTEDIDDYISQKVGKMHACGHDGHTTMLLGAAALLKEMEESINGTVRLMFQPAEEGGAGAKRMREEGILALEPKPQHAFGLHVWPTIPSGTVASRPGPLLAACERFEILIAGVGGHAAMPHLTIDPIVTASSIVMNLQTLVSRTLSPLESGVCSITKFEAGDAYNVIPSSALLRGTIRALSTETLLQLRDRVHHVVTTTAQVHGCNVTITYSPDYYPPTVNDPELFTWSKNVGALVAEGGHLLDIDEPTMAAEDFSFVAETIPSTFFLLGQGSGKAPDTNYGLHHPHFALDESVMPRGVQLHVNLALRALKKLGQKNNNDVDDKDDVARTA